MLLYEFKMNCLQEVQGYSDIIKLKEEFLEKVQEINNSIGVDRIEEPMLAFICQASSTGNFMVAAVDELQRVNETTIHKFLKSILEPQFHMIQIKVEKLREITAEQFRHLLTRGERTNFINSYRIANDLQLDFSENNSFSVAESMCTEKQLTHTKAKQLAKKLMADTTFLDELERIYSKDNSRKQFYGHPVHYKITAGNHNSAMKMVDLLVGALYTNKRLVSQRITRVYDITERCYSEEDFVNLIRQAQGGTVVIELRGQADEQTNYASCYEEVVDFISNTVSKYQRNTLCVFLEMVDQPGFAPNLISRLQDEMHLIELQEGAGDRDQALDYLKTLRKDSNMNVYDDEDLENALGERLTFRASDIHAIHEKLYSDSLKNKIYKAYKDVDHFMLQEDKDKKGDAYKTLQEMIGLKEQKKTLNQILASYKVQKMRTAMGLETQKMSKHMCFTGNPGSAKTTVARLFADILNKEGILETGRFIECGRADLVGKYVGWTAKIVQQKFRQARGGILFIDEAYSLVEHWSGSYGDEAISTIVQEMENQRDKVIVIFAGYTDKMKDFLERNEGLKSRIAFHLDFPDYNAQELTEILKLMVKEKGFKLSKEVVNECQKIFEKTCKSKNFGNGRFVRNLLEQAIMKQAQRIIDENVDGQVSKEQLLYLEAEDFKVGIGELYKKSAPRLGFNKMQ